MPWSISGGCMRTIAIFGGTFDPIHEGHLQTSIQLQNTFHFEKYFFLPCKVSPLKHRTIATEQQRVDMIHLAIQNYPSFQLDTRELLREGPSYMVDTLESFRHDYPHDSLNLILGNDAFNSLPHWHQWDRLISLANLIVMHRRTSPIFNDTALQKLLQQHQTKDPDVILKNPSGYLFCVHAGDFAISSTSIRQDIQNNKNVSTFLSPAVHHYIQQKKLYQSH